MSLTTQAMQPDDPSKRADPSRPWHHFLLGWARPDYPSDTSLEAAEWRKQHDEVSNTIWNLTSILVATCIFCIVTLGASDATLVSNDANIEIPVAKTSVSYTGFLFFGPIILIGLTLYLQVFIEQRLKLGACKGQQSSPYLFNLGWPSANLLAALLFYWMLPAVLAFFVWKALPRPEAPLMMVLLAAVTAVMLMLGIRRSYAAGEPLTPAGRTALVSLWVLLVVSVLVFGILLAIILISQIWASRSADSGDGVISSSSIRKYSGLLPTRRLQLFDAPLEQKNLSGLYAPNADMRKAHLKGADLEGADLSHADLREADFSGANLQGANLSDARLEGATLTGAALSLADLRGARIDDHTKIEDKWKRVACISTGDANADCFKKLDLTWSDLAGANLRNSHLAKMDLTGSDLSYADLTGANLSGTSLRLADLRYAKLPDSVKQASVDGALTGNRQLTGKEQTVVRLKNRTTESCLQTPPPAQPDAKQPRMSEAFPCENTRDNRDEWSAKRLSNGYITFESTISKQSKPPTCLDSTSGGEDSQVQMWECNDDYDNQWWKLVLAHDGHVMIEKRDTHLCLDSTGHRDGSPVPILRPCAEEKDNHDQHWKILAQ